MQKVLTDTKQLCVHCGNVCKNTPVYSQSKVFCCDGCKSVYELLADNNLCQYYDFEDSKGIKLDKPIVQGKYAYLDNADIIKSLIQFQDDTHTIVRLNLPQIHCSSCIWLLEKLYRIDSGISESKVDFSKKSVTIRYKHSQTSLRNVVEILDKIGYTPLLSTEKSVTEKFTRESKKRIIKLGVAGFCFGNIMLLSFPEYLAYSSNDYGLTHAPFKLFAFLLSLPVFFYSASEFYIPAWKGLKKGFLTIDLPVFFAVVVTFFRSIYEIANGYSGGYFDSMSGIVFFMLLGRVFQDLTHKHISFDRKNGAFVPLGISKKTEAGFVYVPVKDIQPNDTILVRNEEIIPADSVLLSEKATLDYSFVTGESDVKQFNAETKLYAGGKVIGQPVELLVIQKSDSSYLKSLWENSSQRKETDDLYRESYVHRISNWFTLILFVIAFVGFGIWMFFDKTIAFNVLTTVLIVACPCVLLLSHTYTYGFVSMNLFKKGIYLKNPLILERSAKIDTLVFDKTGTLTTGSQKSVQWDGDRLSDTEFSLVKSVVQNSTHPKSVMITNYLDAFNHFEVVGFTEVPGKGLNATVNGVDVKIGSADFMNLDTAKKLNSVYVAFNNTVVGHFQLESVMRTTPSTFKQSLEAFDVAVVSGDNALDLPLLQNVLPAKTTYQFNCLPHEKFNFVEQKQHEHKNVAMIGDGINDSGALAQANVGISLALNNSTFVPACDVYVEEHSFNLIPDFLHYAKSAKKIILITFIIALIYNTVGLFFCITGQLTPGIAAILMPLSTFSIITTSYFLTSLKFKPLKNA